MAQTDIDPRIDRVFEAFDDQDAEKAVAEFADGGVFVETADDNEFSKAEFREYLADRVFVGFPDYSIVEKTVMSTYEWATVIEYTFQATHDGPLGDIDPTGNTVTLPIVAVITITDDGITSWRDYVDGQRFAAQLGIE